MLHIKDSVNIQCLNEALRKNSGTATSPIKMRLSDRMHFTDK